MRSSLSLAFALGATMALAGPSNRFASSDLDARSATCLSNADAARVANNFKALINLPFNTTLATQALTSDFQDYADGVNELINAGCANGPKALGSATFSSRAEFISGQSGQQPIPFEILNTWHTCDSVFMRWRSSAPGFVQPELPVTGLVIMETVPEPNDPEPWQIQTVYSEFNSGAWLVDIGNFTAKCS